VNRGGTPGAGQLERGYRRLLAWYPAGHRRVHEEEMLGVLLAAARPGQRRPRLTEAANLIWGALRIRFRPAPAGTRLAVWRDALATFSVALPLFMLATVSTRLAVWLLSPPAVAEFSLTAISRTLLLQGQLVLVVLVLLRLRRPAALLALGMAVFFAGLVIHTGFATSWALFGVLLTLLEAAALAASPGPRRGLQILAGWRVLLPAVAGIAAGVLQQSTRPAFPHPVATQAATFTVAAVLLAGLAVASPLSRHVLLLFVIPVFPLAVQAATSLDPAFFASPELYGSASAVYLAALYYAVPVLVAGLVAACVLRARRRAVPDGAPSATE
jgi:hypothetical protein